MYQVNLPFQGQPSKLSDGDHYLLGDFLRSDHMSFWNHYPSMSAIFLSDTADQRGYMKSCYHQNCDNLSHVTSEMLQFLQKTTDTILATVNDVTKLSCNGTTTTTTTGKMAVGKKKIRTRRKTLSWVFYSGICRSLLVLLSSYLICCTAYLIYDLVVVGIWGSRETNFFTRKSITNIFHKCLSSLKILSDKNVAVHQIGCGLFFFAFPLIVEDLRRNTNK